MYLNREFLVVDEADKPCTISDMEFAQKQGPKVLLGAPGGGKTEACKEINAQFDGQMVHAEDIVSGLFDCGPKHENQLLVIDGLDEVASEEIPKAFVNIIREVRRLGFSNWLISCRSYEWRSALFEPRITSVFGNSPAVANMGDLSDNEVIGLLRAFEYEGDAAQFLKDAEAKEATDLLRNPQTLKMLSQAVRSSGWPSTKTDLFASACAVMASEDNEVHRARSVDRPTQEKVIEAAGWVCAQLLMSGGRAVSFGGETSAIIFRPADMASEANPEPLVSAACQSKLFKAVERENVEPAHRIVAEYLAGRWLAREFCVVPKNLSPSRVMGYLTFGTGEIPPALRGLHAWTTSLDQTLRMQNIQNDPYECLRYGDLSRFSDEELKSLLQSLVSLSATDPFFRGQDWYAGFGRSLGRVSIKKEFVETVSNAEVSYQLKCTLLDAIQGTDLADEVIDDLREIVLNNDLTPRERHSAIDALASSSKSFDWRNLAADLLTDGTAASLRISIDSVISDNPSGFSGQEIAEHIIAYESATSNEDDGHVAGVGFRLSRECSDKQTKEIANSIAQQMPRDPERTGAGVHKGLEEWLLEFLPRVLSNDDEASASEIWNLISRLSGHSYRKSEWEKVAQPLFHENDELRRSIQSLAFTEATDNIHGWMTMYRLSEISAGLHLRETDVVYHLGTLIAANNKPSDWEERWKSLVRWTQANRSFEGAAMELAKEQASAVPELKPILEELLRPPIKDYEKEHREEERKRAAKRRVNARVRHENYAKARDDIKDGKNLGALNEIARASLGHFSEFKETSSPRERVEALVGAQTLDAAILGLEVAASKSDLPSVRECVELRTRENKEFYIERICLAYCVDEYLSGNPLSLLPRQTLLCALSACRWGLHFPNNASEELQSKLEEVLFKDLKTKEMFVRDTIEPYLQNGEEHVSGFHRVTTEEQFADILPSLALEWLTKYENASANTVWSLLQAAVRITDTAEFADIIDARLQKDEWETQEHRSAWHAAAFVVDFQRFRRSISSFADETKDRIWPFSAIVSNRRSEEYAPIYLDEDQVHFLVEKFAPSWPPASPPSGGWSGSHNPWDATQWILHLISMLSEMQSESAIEHLVSLSTLNGIDRYRDHVLHALTNARRAFAEQRHSTTTLLDVRNVLLSGKPTNVADLQTLFLEEFDKYQARIRTGQTNTYLTYWEGEKPHIENYCRDRLLEGLEQQMEAFQVRVHKEGAMADETRVDLLLSCDGFDLPVEIKRQWHPDIWSAACDQLERYSENYRTDGTGVYLVVWHGSVKGMTIPKPSIGTRPRNSTEMLEALHRNLPRELSSATRLVVLDVSKTK